MLRLELKLHDDRYALARLAPGSAMPSWAEGEFTAVLRSAQGFTLCCRETAVPPDVEAQGGFRCFEIAGPFDLNSVGVVAAVAGPLAAAGVFGASQLLHQPLCLFDMGDRFHPRFD